MVSIDDVRRLATDLLGVTEGTHFSMVSFKVADKGFAAISKDECRLMLQLGDEQARDALDRLGSAGRPLTRMGKPIGVEVDLAEIDLDVLALLLEWSWRHRAPRKLVDSYDHGDQT